MYRVIKVLNNNGILVYHVKTGRELILLGNGVGFGRKPSEQISQLPGAKVYSLINRRKQDSVLKVVNGIRPEFIEAAGKIIEEAEKEFGEINKEILLPMSDHIALAADSESIYAGYQGVICQRICSGFKRPRDFERDDGI